MATAHRCSTSLQPRITLLCTALGICVGLALSRPVRACSLDGVPSIAMNGHVAVQTVEDPTRATLRHWAPFTFALPGIAGKVVHFTENVPLLRPVLPATALATTFRWEFGDGHTARGMDTLHRYRDPGWYRITVQCRWPSVRSWVAFDSAQVHIVAPTRAVRRPG